MRAVNNYRYMSILKRRLSLSPQDISKLMYMGRHSHFLLDEFYNSWSSTGIIYHLRVSM